MNSLKKKFGKFAVSSEKMAKVNGGSDLQCYSNGEPVGSKKSENDALDMVLSGEADTCSN